MDPDDQQVANLQHHSSISLHTLPAHSSISLHTLSAPPTPLTTTDDDLLGLNVGEFVSVVVIVRLEVRVGLHRHQVRPVWVVGKVGPCGEVCLELCFYGDQRQVNRKKKSKKKRKKLLLDFQMGQ